MYGSTIRPFRGQRKNPNPPAEDHTAEDLLALMDANGVEKTVLVQVIHYRWDNSYVAHVIKQYPDRFMAVGRINPEDPASPDHMVHVDGGTRPARDAALAVAGCERRLVQGAGDGSDFRARSGFGDTDVDSDRGQPDAGFGADSGPLPGGGLLHRPHG